MKDTLALAGGGHIAYEVIGEGPPLLLVSGLGGLASFWGEFTRRCARHFTVITHDHRGTGASSRCDRPYSIDSMADDVLALMAHLGLERPLYAGHSTGGAIGQHLAARKGIAFSRLVLSATFARPCSYFRRLFESRLQLLEVGGLAMYREHTALLLHPPYWLATHDLPDTALAATPHPLDAEILRRRIAAVMAHDALDALNRVQCPTLVVAARDDIVTPVYHSQQLADEIPDAELALLPRGGHYVPRTETDRYASVVLDFLRYGNSQ
jgi:aminoacrylate hydrolase